MRAFVTIGVDVDDEDTAIKFAHYIRNHCVPNFDDGLISDAVVTMIR